MPYTYDFVFIFLMFLAVFVYSFLVQRSNLLAYQRCLLGTSFYFLVWIFLFLVLFFGLPCYNLLLPALHFIFPDI